jgi:hypothetical protein
MTKKYYSYEETHRTVSGRKQKLCTKCIKWKDKREFHKDRYRKDGLKIRCKECDKADAHERRRKNRRKRKNVRQYLRYEQRHRTIRGVKQKLCCSCNKWKDESHYSRHRQLKDGLSLKCKDCERKRYARKRLEQKNRKWKKESEYYKYRSSKDGLMGQCRKCSYKPAHKSHKRRPKLI